MSKIVTLEITCWAFSLGGQHYSGKITGYRNGDYTNVRLTHKLTAKEALALNKKDRVPAFAQHQPGDLSERFDTQEQVEREALRVWQKEFPDAVALNVGCGAAGDPQRVLAGPKWFMDATNLLHQKREEAGGYEGNHEVATKLFRDYRKLVAKL